MEFVKKLVIIFVVGLLILTGISILSDSGNGDDVPVEEPTPVETSTKTDFMGGFRDAYMEGCVSEEVSYAYCSCTYDYLLDVHGVEGMYELSMSDNIEAGMWDAVLECLDLL